MTPEVDEMFWWRAAGWVALLLFFAAFYFIANRSSKKQQVVVEEEREKHVKIGIEKGVLNEYGEPMCVVCGQTATRYGVLTGRAWFDRIPLIARLNTLYAMPWRYTVVDDYEAGHRLCGIHRRAAEHRLEQAHAQMRSDHAQFNAQQQQKVAMLDQGGLEQLLREDTEEIKRKIGFRGVVVRTFERLPEHAVHVLPVTSTDRADE